MQNIFTVHLLKPHRFRRQLTCREHALTVLFYVYEVIAAVSAEIQRIPRAFANPAHAR